MCGNGLLAVDLSIEQKGGDVIVQLINRSNASVCIDKRMIVGGNIGWNELTMILRDSAGNEYPFSSRIQVGAATELDICVLMPNELVGHIFKITQIKRWFNLLPGNYFISVKYRPGRKDVNIFSNQLESNTICLSID